MEELRQAALEYISSAELADLDELTSSINARHEAARVKAADEAQEVVVAAHSGETERLRALLEANPNLVDSVQSTLLLAEMKPLSLLLTPPQCLTLRLAAPTLRLVLTLHLST